ncbi:unnamed protein product [Anisakis simplex]|uniref:VWFA domain-containing protein n=1 Tax=Anisakis simplex TaxID=6269 RepID=A0A0M3IY84_ANISI|nr:unnamed protein product [Anisakis simplex]
MDVIFVLDTSGSIEQVYAEHIRWTLALVDALPVNRDRVRIAAIQYAGFPLTEFALGTYFSANDIRQHLSQITFQSGVTRTGYALRKADSELFREQRGARANATKIIVLFTDGLSIDDPLKPAHQLRDVKNVKIYVVSVGSDGFEPEMNRIAGDKRNKPPSDVKEEFKRNQLTTTQQHNSEEDSSVKNTLHNKTKNAVSSKKALKMESSSNASQLNSTVEEMNAFSSFSLASTQQQQKNSKSAAQRDDESSGGDSKESLEVTSTATPLSSESSEDLPSQDHSKSSDRAIQSASKSKSALSSSQSSSNTRTNSSSSSRESIGSEDEAAEDQLVNANENAEKLLNKTDENEQQQQQQQQQQKKSSQRITTNINTAHRNANDNDDNNGDNDNRQQSSSSTLNNPSSSALASSSSTSKSSNSSSKAAAQSAKSHSSSKQQLSLKSKSSSMIKSASAAASKHTNTVTAALNSLKKSNSKSAEAAASAINKQSQLETQTKLEHLLTSHETKNIHKITTNTIPTEKNTQKSSEEDEVEASSTAPFIESAEQTDDESSNINESSIQGSQGASPSQAHSTPHSIAHHHSKQQKQKQSKSKPQKQANEASNQAVAATIHRASSTPRVPSSSVVCPLDFLFIVDSSGSVQSIYYKQKQYLTSILSEIQVGEQRVALLQFAGGSHQKTEWTFDTFHDGEAVMEAFANVRHFTGNSSFHNQLHNSGTTYIGRALEASFDLLQLRRNSVPTIVVLLSDGFSQDDATEPAERIRRLANVDFYTVSISDLILFDR